MASLCEDAASNRLRADAGDRLFGIAREFNLSWRLRIAVRTRVANSDPASHVPAPERTGTRCQIMSRRSTHLFITLLVALLAGCATPTERRSAPSPRYVLSAAQSWQLNLPDGERFDASGLCLDPNDDLLTVNDRAPAVYRIQFLPGLSNADLV